MRSVGAFEAKTHLSKLLDEVAAGATITITKHGVPVAILAPPDRARRDDPAKAVEALKRWQAENQITTGGMSVREMIEAGRR